MSKKKAPNRKNETAGVYERARDELYSHILRCGVLDAAPEHQQDWFNDTMEYLAERYDTLTDDELTQIRRLGEVYCRPVVKHSDLVGATDTT